MYVGADAVDYLPPADEHNPYAAPQSSLKEEYLLHGQYGDAPITEPNPNARVRISAIGDAWELFKEKMSTWILIILVYLACAMGIGIASNLMAAVLRTSMGIAAQPQRPEDLAGFVAITVLQQIVTQSITAVLIVGLFRTAIRQVRGLPIQVSDLFSATDVWLTAIVATFLIIMATIAGLFIFIIGALYIASRLLFTLPLVADARLKATDAMALSWQALQGQVFMAWWFSFVVAIVSGIGVLGCGIGILFTMPLMSLSYAVLYRDFFLPPPALAGSPWITTKPDLAPEF